MIYVLAMKNNEADVIGLAKKIVAGFRLCRSMDLSFFEKCSLSDVRKGADFIREKLCGAHVELCSIMNGRSGRCQENCMFCAQSLFNKTSCAEYPFVSEIAILKAAEAAENSGVRRFSIVTSGRALDGDEFQQAVRAYKMVHGNLKVGLCASMGFLTEAQLIQLKEAGVTMYHHNIETSRNNFPNICTTHSYDMKIDTIRTAKKIGLSVCSGGIIGMGETFADRIDMALSLSELGVQSIPINALTPIKGTAFESMPLLSEDEILRTVALFRYINPDSFIRLAAGRKLLSGGGENAFSSGANAALTGNMLTTTGTTIDNDKKLLEKLGRRF